MSRDDGFVVMDVSTDIVNDPKVRKLYRHAPDHAGAGFAAYIATMADSWRAGRRVSVDDAWPACIPFDKPAVDALIHVGLLDRTGRIPVKSWRGWYEAARIRREKSRDRWRRYNEKRDADTTDVPRGSDADTATSVPPVRPSSLPTGSSVPPARARGKKNALEREPTREEALFALSEDYKAGRISEVDYERERRVLAS
jgi:hypothetical protein